ncbi:MAG: ShlB/FhaC/HecB family hemolysin secretion/activation protein [Pikeienuella sp.]|uniref:ShlB/FhaC/HecB family hemolysin secretion/activation protein n=1 Tax=Pikeienuella sp. TaxID=2831957 RepID=UPI00391B05D8
MRFALACLAALAAFAAAAEPLEVDVDMTLRAVLLTPEDSPLIGEEGLRAAAEGALGRRVDLAALEALRREMTEALVAAGYVSSGVRLRTVDAGAGEATFEIVAGRLTGIRVRGEGVAEAGARGPGEIGAEWLRERVALDDGPFSLPAAEEALRILLRDRNVARVDAAIRPGAGEGETALDLDIAARRPYDAALTLSNDTPDIAGEETARLSLAARNLLFSGDEARLELEGTEGRRRARFEAEAPVRPGGPAPFISFEHAVSEFVREPFRSADVDSTFTRIGFGVTVPLIETSRRRLNGILAFDRKRARSTVAGVPFSFEEGPENGLSRTSVLSLAFEFSDLAEARSLALRVSGSAGLPILGATENAGDLPDGRFFVLVAQAQLAARLTDAATVIARAQGQIADRRLLPLEQVAIGGRDTVRGFGEASLAGDDAAVGSLELRLAMIDLPVPELTPPDHPATLTLAPFIDAGATRRKGRKAEGLIGAGAGLLWSPSPGVDAAFYFGAALSGGSRGTGLQGEGAHLAVTIALP